MEKQFLVFFVVAKSIFYRFHCCHTANNQQPWIICGSCQLLKKGSLTMSTKQSSKKFKWALDFNISKNGDMPSPLGYNPAALVNQTDAAGRDQRLVIKKSWDLALGPLKNIPMNLFIMYMSGNSISIFPIMMVGMMLIRPIKAMFTTQVTSKMAEGAQGTGQRIVYFLGNLANVALALYKCHSMGLLPTHASDWLAFIQPQTRLEHYGGGVSFI